MGQGVSGTMRGLSFEDAGDNAINLNGGEWKIEECIIHCGHATALHVTNNSKVSVDNCHIGGRGRTQVEMIHGNYHQAYGALQIGNITRHCCFGIHAKGEGRLNLKHTTIQYCSESAILIRESASVCLSHCTIADSQSGLLTGDGDGSELNLEDMCFTKVRSIWYDEDRPNKHIWGERMSVSLSEGNEEYEEELRQENLLQTQSSGEQEEIELEDYRATNMI